VPLGSRHLRVVGLAGKAKKAMICGLGGVILGVVDDVVRSGGGEVLEGPASERPATGL
jgi:hypothetical protein